MSKIHLSQKAYIHNLEQIAKKVGSKDRVILILKDNAYGHGATILGKKANELGFNFCATKNEREANELKSIFKDILILSHIPNGDESTKFIYAPNDIKAIQNIKNGTRIHLPINTLMNRNGIGLNEIDDAIELIQKKELVLEGAFTHFRASDELNADYFIQKQKFQIAKQKISEYCYKFNINKPAFHSHNSAALERLNESSDEFVRIGISQFGYSQFNTSLNLKPVLSLWADKISERILKAGSAVGYGAKFTAKNDMRIATYDLGYADGLFRYNGDGDLPLANKNLILGKMSMDSFSSKDAGDSVCVFDDARVWAKFFNTIEYEILVKLSPHIKRIWV